MREQQFLVHRQNENTKKSYKFGYTYVCRPLVNAASSESEAKPISLLATLIVVTMAETSVLETDARCGWPKSTFFKISPDTKQ